MDMMTHNHASGPGWTPPWLFVDEAAKKPGGDCYDEIERERRLARNYRANGKSTCVQKLD